MTKKAIRLRYNESHPARRVDEALNASTLSILYLMLVHDNPDFTIHIINAIDEPQHSFVIHVDTASEDTHSYLLSRLSNRKNIMIMTEQRERITWGAFSIVNATLNGMRLAWTRNISFDYLLLVSGSSYPIKSNRFIRQVLAKSPNTVFMDVAPDPSRPDTHLWHHFVECDGALHRIARMTYIKGINMFISSQWFAAPRHLVQWFLESRLPKDYSEYAKHIIIADENFFATMFMNSPYCQDEVNRNLLFLLFDRWENEKTPDSTNSSSSDNKNGNSKANKRDERKCLNPDTDNCGRSPSTLTMEFKHLISSSRALFARKFDPRDPRSVELVDFIDEKRGSERYFNGSIIDHSRETNLSASLEAWDTNKDDSGKITMIRVGLSKEMLMVMAEEQAHETSNEDKKIDFVPEKNASLEENFSNENQTDITNMSSKVTNATASVSWGPGQGSILAADKGYCLHFDDTNGFVVSAKCDPLDANQWFKIGTEHHFIFIIFNCTHHYGIRTLHQRV